MKTLFVSLLALCLSCGPAFAHPYAGSYECDPISETCDVAMLVKRTGGTGAALFSYKDPAQFGPISGSNSQKQDQCVGYAEGLMQKGFDDQRFYSPSDHIVIRTQLDWVVCFFVTDVNAFLVSPGATDSTIPGQFHKPVLDKLDTLLAE